MSNNHHQRLMGSSFLQKLPGGNKPTTRKAWKLPYDGPELVVTDDTSVDDILEHMRAAAEELDEKDEAKRRCQP